MAEIFGDSLGDPRVSIREADVTEIIRYAPFEHSMPFCSTSITVRKG